MTIPPSPTALTDEAKQNVALLSKVHGVSLREIGQTLQVSHPTVSKLVEIAQARLDGYARAAGFEIDWDDPKAVVSALSSMTGSHSGAPPAAPVAPTPQAPAPITPQDVARALAPTPADPAEDPFDSPLQGDRPAPLDAEAEPQMPPPPAPAPDPAPQPENTPERGAGIPQEAQQNTTGAAPWPMSTDEMDQLAKTFKASFYEPERWPYWAKRLKVGIDREGAYKSMEALYPDAAHRETVYADLLSAIHTGKVRGVNVPWRWVGLNLTVVLPEHKLFTWCQMRADGETIEIKFAKKDKR